MRRVPLLEVVRDATEDRPGAKAVGSAPGREELAGLAVAERWELLAPGTPAVQRALEDVLALRSAGRIRLLIGQRYRFADLPRALADLEARRTTGKSVIMMEQGAG